MQTDGAVGKVGWSMAWAVLVVALVSGCVGVAPPEVEPTRLTGTVTVSAPPALEEILTAVVTQFKTQNPGLEVRLDFAVAGAPTAQGVATPAAYPDVIVTDELVSSSDPGASPAARPAGVARPFAAARLVIAVSADNSAGVAGVRSLATKGLRVALCVREQPCGAASEALLSAAGITLASAVRVADTRAALALVEEGQVDAAMVYRTDARAAEEAVAAVEIPESGIARVAFKATVQQSVAHAAGAAAFVNFLTSSVAQDRLRSSGFEPAP